MPDGWYITSALFSSYADSIGVRIPGVTYTIHIDIATTPSSLSLPLSLFVLGLCSLSLSLLAFTFLSFSVVTSFLQINVMNWFTCQAIKYTRLIS